MIIEGLKESKTDHPRQQTMDLLAGIGVNITAENVVTASRLGPVNPASRRPRHILIRFMSPFWKQEVLKNISKAKDSNKWLGVHVQDDLPPEIIEQRRDLRCLAALAKEKGHRVSLRGGSLVIDEQRYGFHDIGKLPDGINMENAKLVQLEDGWAFQSQHAFPYSMYPCKIKHKGHDFNCVEQAYVYDMAEEAGDQRAMEKVRDCQNGYEAKRIGNRIKKSDEWNNHKLDKAEKLHEKKYEQNPGLRDRLKNLKESSTKQRGTISTAWE